MSRERFLLWKDDFFSYSFFLCPLIFLADASLWCQSTSSVMKIWNLLDVSPSFADANASLGSPHLLQWSPQCLLQHGMCARSCLVKKWITTYCSIFFTHFGFSPGCWFIQAEQISMVKFKVSKYPPLKTQCVIILAAVVSFFKCFDWKQWWWTKNWWLIFREWGLILILGISRVICKVSLQIFKRA